MKGEGSAAERLSRRLFVVNVLSMEARAVGVSGFGGSIVRFSRDYRGFVFKNPIIPLP